MTTGETNTSVQRVPRATYRLQFNRDFTLRRAIELVPYLHDLGISHVYASPLLKACPGSTHGYDVCDCSQLNPEIGTEKDFENFVATLRRHDMGLVLDIVPNHMGIGPENPWWWDVLKHGPTAVLRNTSTLTGTRPTRRSRAKCLCRCWAMNTNRCWTAANSNWSLRAAKSCASLFRSPLSAGTPVARIR